MSSTEQAPEPTMDEILASIRRIIADDDPNANPAAAGSGDEAGRPIAADALPRDPNRGSAIDDILDLTKEIGLEPAPPDAAPQAAPPAAEPPAAPPPLASEAAPPPPLPAADPMAAAPAPRPQPASPVDAPAPAPNAAPKPNHAGAPPAPDATSALEAALSAAVADPAPRPPEPLPRAEEPPAPIDFDGMALDPAPNEAASAPVVAEPPALPHEKEAAVADAIGLGAETEDRAARLAAEVEAALGNTQPESDEPSGVDDIVDTVAQFEALAPRSMPPPADPSPAPEASQLPAADESVAEVAEARLPEPDSPVEEEPIAQDNELSQSMELPDASPPADMEASPDASVLAAEAPDAGDTEAPVRSLEDSVKELLKPMLREWLDDNMPRILEGAVRDELSGNDEHDGSESD